jgi:hypothetical protein
MDGYIGSIPGRRNIFLRHCVQVGTAVHPSYLSGGYRELFFGGKVAGR